MNQFLNSQISMNIKVKKRNKLILEEVVEKITLQLIERQVHQSSEME